MTPSGAAVFLCSPRPGGNSDTAGLTFAAVIEAAGIPVRIIRLRDHCFAPCRGCGACAAPGNRCPLDTARDAAASLFTVMTETPIIAFASPIYFYHLPAVFKALIDRAQRPYAARMAAGESAAAKAPALAQALLVSGRARGERLFEGALLTLKYFLWPFFRKLAEPCLLRGLDAPGDLAGDGAALDRVRAYARDAARDG